MFVCSLVFNLTYVVKSASSDKTGKNVKVWMKKNKIIHHCALIDFFSFQLCCDYSGLCQ